MSQQQIARSTSALPPSRIQWRVMSLVTIIAIITYLDRLNLSIAGKYIQDQFKFNTQTMGWLFSAFLLGYALFQIPGGWAGDRFGPRNVLTFAVFWWSVLTALTALAPRLFLVRIVGVAWSFAIVRFLVGVGEASSSPNLNKIVSYWMGSNHRGKGASFTILGIGIGGAATPPLIAWLMLRWGWQTSFYVCAALGLIVTAVWHRTVANRPEEHPDVNPAEMQAIVASRETTQRANGGSTPWKSILSSKSTWGLVLGYMCQGFPIYFFHTWFFIYLVQVRGFSVTKGSLWGSAPYLAIACLAPVGGWFSDFAVRHFGKQRGRQTAVWCGMGLSALCVLAGSAVADRVAATALLAMGAGLNMFAATTFWATCIDLAPDYTGSISGLMNTFGNLGGWLSPIVSAYLAIHYGWNRALLCAALVTIASALLWLLVDASRRVDLTDDVQRAASAAMPTAVPTVPS